MQASASAAPARKKKVDWVQCEECDKWRILPASVALSSLPDQWTCAMNTWNSFNSCDKPDEAGADNDDDEPHTAQRAAAVAAERASSAASPHDNQAGEDEGDDAASNSDDGEGGVSDEDDDDQDVDLSPEGSSLKACWPGIPKEFIKDSGRQRFFNSLLGFYKRNGNKISRFPHVGKKPLDLWILYEGVTCLGGFDKVVSSGWRPIAEMFNFPPTTTSSGNSLKKNYEKYLLEYEQAHFHDVGVVRGSVENWKCANWVNKESSRQRRKSAAKASEASTPKSTTRTAPPTPPPAMSLSKSVHVRRLKLLEEAAISTSSADAIESPRHEYLYHSLQMPVLASPSSLASRSPSLGRASPPMFPPSPSKRLSPSAHILRTTALAPLITTSSSSEGEQEVISPPATPSSLSGAHAEFTAAAARTLLPQRGGPNILRKRIHSMSGMSPLPSPSNKKQRGSYELPSPSAAAAATTAAVPVVEIKPLVELTLEQMTDYVERDDIDTVLDLLGQCVANHEAKVKKNLRDTTRMLNERLAAVHAKHRALLMAVAEEVEEEEDDEDVAPPVITQPQRVARRFNWV